MKHLDLKFYNVVDCPRKYSRKEFKKIAHDGKEIRGLGDYPGEDDIGFSFEIPYRTGKKDVVITYEREMETCERYSHCIDVWEKVEKGALSSISRLFQDREEKNEVYWTSIFDDITSMNRCELKLKKFNINIKTVLRLLNRSIKELKDLKEKEEMKKQTKLRKWLEIGKELGEETIEENES